MVDEDFVYSRMGMALLSAQRVEFLTRELLSHLVEFDSTVYAITPSDFLQNSPSADALRKQTLGQIFKRLKLVPKLVLSDVLDEYLKKRNILVHHFYREYLHTKSEEQTKKALKFCYDFGRLSTKLESFFKGFLYFLALRHVKDREHIEGEMKACENDFNYFMDALTQKSL